MENIRDFFGDINIYLFDQIQKGRFTREMKILDAGCDGGQNLTFFMRMGCEVFAVDQNAEAIKQIKYFAKMLVPNLSADNFQTSTVEKMPFPDNYFDCVISNAVLHFAENKHQFN